MGAAASGAQDANGFASAMSGKYLPQVDTLTYQGVFNEHFYSVGENETEHAVATSCFAAWSEDPWVAVFLKSALDGKPRDDIPIDLSVVIDISGSMSGGMSRCQTQQGGSRLEHAKRGVEWLLKEVLRDGDGIAVTTFNQSGHVVHPLTGIGSIDCEAFLEPVRALCTSGGTMLAAGMQVGREMLGSDFSTRRHRRILFLTDMGEMNAFQLGELIQQNADEGVYVSILAMGAEFNSALTETVTKHRGSNYFCATDDAQLRRCLVDDFAFNMFPAAFDINISVCAGVLEVDSVYGTPFDTTAVQDLKCDWTSRTNAYYGALSKEAALRLHAYSQSIRMRLDEGVIGNVIDYLERPITSITEVDTMFPSRLEPNGAMKGGLILIRFRSSVMLSVDQPVKVKLTYTDVAGQQFEQLEEVVIPCGSKVSMGGQYDTAVSKALLLQRYVQVCRENMETSSLDNSIPWEEVKARRERALPALQACFDYVVSQTDSLFADDKQMKEVSKNFASFVEVFSSPLRDTAQQAIPDCDA